MSELLSLLKLSWDLPWRLGASFAGLAAAISFWVESKPLRVISGSLEWLGIVQLEEYFRFAAEWVDERQDLLALIGFAVFVIAGIVMVSDRDAEVGRAPATLILGSALAIQAGLTVTAWIALVAVGLWLVALIVRVVVAIAAPYLPEEIAGVEEWLRRAWGRPLIAAFYFPVAPFTWAVRS